MGTYQDEWKVVLAGSYYLVLGERKVNTETFYGPGDLSTVSKEIAAGAFRRALRRPEE